MHKATPRYKYKAIARILEYSKDKDPAIDPPDRVIEYDPVYLSKEEVEKEDYHGFNE